MGQPAQRMGSGRCGEGRRRSWRPSREPSGSQAGALANQGWVGLLTPLQRTKTKFCEVSSWRGPQVARRQQSWGHPVEGYEPERGQEVGGPWGQASSH